MISWTGKSWAEKLGLSGQVGGLTCLLPKDLKTLLIFVCTEDDTLAIGYSAE